MLRQEDYLMILLRRREGVSIKDIAEEFGVHPKTVSRTIQRGGPPSGRRQPRGSLLDAYRWKLDALMAENVWNGRVMLRELQALGYEGSYTVVNDYMRPFRAKRRAEGRATVRFETGPGEQLQHDWGELWVDIGGESRKVFFAVNTLGYSRRFHVVAGYSLDAEQTYECLVRSFAYFGGVTRTVLVDNQKSAVLEHRPGSVRFNPRFVDLAAHYGFTPKACRPYRARTKGKTERMVHYVKDNFFARYRQFESLAHLNELLLAWLTTEADPRVHGTHGEVVIERFTGEADSLSPLPDLPYDTSYRESRVVSWDGYIEVRGNRYSVPSRLCGTTVRVHIALDDTLRVVDSDETVAATHPLRPVHCGWQTVPEHHVPLWERCGPVERRDLAVYEEAGQWN